MLTDFIVVKDVFDNPDDIIEFAKRQEYFTRDKHNEAEGSHYSGLRTKSLAEIDPLIYHTVNNQIFTKCSEQIYPQSTNKVTYGFGFETSSFFHILKEEDKPTPDWWHMDKDCIWAGVVYLNKNPKPNTGTIVRIDGKDIEVENEFNKLVMYLPTYEHMSMGGFGNNVDDCRLTLTFFVNAFQFKIKSI